MADRPDISVVIPTYQRPDLLRQCLEALASQDMDRSRYEVVVVDDGSGREVSELLARFARDWSGLRWHRQDTNQGPAAARNRGAADCQADIVLFMDDDIVATTNLLTTHLALHRTADDGTLGIVGRVEWHPALTVTPFMRWLDSTSHQFAYQTWMREGSIVRPWEAFYTCNLSLHRALFESCGGFDETFPYAACEDTELGYRLWRKGFHLEYRPAALAWNARPISLRDFLRRMERAGESLVVLKRLQPDLETVQSRVPEEDTPADSFTRKVLRALAEPGRMRKLQGMGYQRLVARAYASGIRAREQLGAR